MRSLALEPVHPAPDGVVSSTRPDGIAELHQEARRRVSVAGGLGVIDGVLGHPVRLAPRRGAAVKLRDRLRITSPQLRHEQLAEQLVVPVPLPAAVEGNHQQVAALQPLEECGRSRDAEDGVAERTAHPVENRRVGQEGSLRRRDPVEDLRAQVVPDVPVIASQRHGHRRVQPPAFTASAARYRPTGQPSVLRTSSSRSAAGELDPRLQEQRARLVRIHRQIVDPDLHDAALRA